MDRWQNRVAVVTGASSGIGAAVVKDLLTAGMVVVGLARRLERMEEIRAALPAEQRDRLHTLQCDVTDLNAVITAFDWIEANLGGVDILINNAGKLSGGQIVQKDIAAMQEMIQTNIMGVIHCTQHAYKSMKEHNIAGHVLLINSVVGHYIFNPLPGYMQELNIYPATKHAVTAMTELLRQEFRDFGTKIKVTSISPGLVDTELVPQQYKTLPMLTSEDVAAAIMYALGTPPHVQVHELILKPLGEPF